MRSEKTTTVALIVALDPTSIADTCFRSPEYHTPMMARSPLSPAVTA
jgi:hypothetical protein